jgi:hypothetical protein
VVTHQKISPRRLSLSNDTLGPVQDSGVESLVVEMPVRGPEVVVAVSEVLMRERVQMVVWDIGGARPGRLSAPV